jgi:stress-induced morphogen
LNSIAKPFRSISVSYCTFRDVNVQTSPTKAVEAEEVAEELGEDEIPLVESHWDEYESELKNRLESKLNATKVEIWDKTRPGCGIVLEIHVESPLFASLSKVEQSRLVSNSLKGLVDDVHAITIKTRLPSSN